MTLNILRRIHNKLFGRHLWITNTVSSGVLFGIGDGIQQNIELIRGTHASKLYDWKRTQRLFLVGLTQGPTHHLFYSWLDKIYPKRNAKTILKKIILDQILAAPFFAVTFFLAAGLLEGKSLAGFWNEFKKKFLVIYVFDWCLWPPAQAVNFYIIPSSYRVVYINCITVIWDIFLSYMKHNDQPNKGTGKQIT